MKHTKAIVSSAVALALTAGITATVWATNTTPPAESVPVGSVEFVDSIKYDSETVTKGYNSLEETLSPFEIAAVMGEEPIDPCGRTFPVGHEVVDETASTNSTQIKLTKSDITDAYNYWVGRFVVPDVSKFSITFNEPESFSCSYFGSEKTASIVAKPNFLGNYKKVKIRYTYLWYDSNGNPQYDIFVAYEEGTNPYYSAHKDYTGKGKLVDVMCFYTLRSGTGSGASIRDYAFVDLIDSSYANSAEFAALPYAGLIDQYTFISADELL